MIQIRPAKLEDKAAIAKVCQETWDDRDANTEGDYVPKVFEKWVSDKGEFAVVCVDDVVAGCGKMSMLTEDDAWLEGLRVDSSYRGLGLGKALNRYFISKAKEKALNSLRLSTYVENEASIHIIEKYGFKKIANFVVLEAQATKLADNDFTLIQRLSNADEVLAALDPSIMKKRKDFVSFEWTFQKLNSNLIKELVANQCVFGIRGDQDKLEALIIISDKYCKETGVSLVYMQGEPHYATLVQFALSKVAQLGYKKALTMCPDDEKQRQALREAGFYGYDNRDVNVFVYEHEDLS